MPDGSLRYVTIEQKPHYTPVLAEFNKLTSLIPSSLPNKLIRVLHISIGNALAAALKSNSIPEALQCFDGIKDKIRSQIDSFLKIRLFWVILIATPIFTLSAYYVFHYLGVDITFFYCCASGIIGAFVSTIQRSQNKLFDPFISIYQLITEAVSRLVIGGIFGVLLLMLKQQSMQ